MILIMCLAIFASGISIGYEIAQILGRRKLPYNKTERPAPVKPTSIEPYATKAMELPKLPKTPNTIGSMEAALYAKHMAVVSEFSQAKDPGYKCARCGKLADKINRRDGLDIPYCDECDINRVA